MESPPGPPPRARLGLPILLGFVFVATAPDGLLLLPLTGLLWTAPIRVPGLTGTAILATLPSLWWLSQTGELPDQIVRTAGAVGAVSFVGLSRTTSWTVTHRAVAAVGAAAAAVGIWMVTLGISWDRIRWWVAFQQGGATRELVTRLWLQAPRGPTGLPEGGSDSWAAQWESLLMDTVPLMADYYAATVALQTLVGCLLAAWILHRIRPGLEGRSVGAFTQFRFNEQIGWLAVGPLAVILFAPPGELRLLAANVLVVTLGLYSARGAAVAWSAFKARGGPGLPLRILLVLSAVFLLPAVLAWTIVLGVADSGFDLRRRWLAPPQSRD